MKLTLAQRTRLEQLSRDLAMNFDIPARDHLAWAAANLGWSLKKLDAARTQIFNESDVAQPEGECRHCGARGTVGTACTNCEPSDGIGPMIFQSDVAQEVSK